ncbi:MFS multidrug transporter [Colletotrichum karsti]|uniref:MFS multidrug transporter n=1 Tax=Colletotrichum karsti TaxID=1095194 RepID=A0A9P6LQV8_9PEZI|nr:MFS multidrug transporter [Colletotrichum karsti]KAF9882256.1 MFS multidrug transporter [Colletotrichum karsti]
MLENVRVLLGLARVVLGIWSPFNKSLKVMSNPNRSQYGAITPLEIFRRLVEPNHVEEAVSKQSPLRTLGKVKMSRHLIIDYGSVGSFQDSLEVHDFRDKCLSTHKSIEMEFCTPRTTITQIHDPEACIDSGSNDGTTSQEGHPRQWGSARKIYDTSLIIFLEFFTTMISTAGTPVAEHEHRNLGLSAVAATSIFVSTYLIAQAIGGVFLPPWSESFGRKKLYVASTALYSVSCVIVGAMPTIPGVVIGRLAGGFLSAAPTVISTGSIEDMWDTKARVWWIFMWALMANMAILAGPVFGAAIMSQLSWPWIFYTAAIVTGVLAILLMTIKESRPSVALAKIESEATGNPNTAQREHLDIIRPLRLFFTEPIVFFVSVISAMAFGLIYLFTEVLPMVYVGMGFEGAWKNLPFLALGIGMLLTLLTRFYDNRVFANRTAAHLPITPESKCAGFVIGAPILAIGLWCFAWTIPPQVSSVHWAVPTAALIPVGYAVNEFDHVLAGYLTDCYQTYAASGFAALALVRSLCCATFPLFGRIMFEALDFNIALTVFAVIATVLCVVPPILLRYGRVLRQRSALAAK